MNVLPLHSPIDIDTRVEVLKGLQRITDNLESIGLRPGQKNVMHDLQAFFASHEKGYVAMPTGSGKTVLFATMLASHDVKSLIVVPTKQLIAQTIEELQLKGIEQVGTTLDLRSTSIREKYDARQVVVTSYAQLVKSSTTPWGKHIINPQDYGMVILDEAHHALAEGATRALRQFNHAFQVGFTATPNYSEARKLTHRLPEVIHELSISEAIDVGLIAPYVSTVLLTNADMSDVRTTRNEYDRKQLDRALNTKSRNEDISEFFVAELADKKTVFSCNSIDHAIAMTEELQARGVKAEYVYGTMPKYKIDDVLGKFKRGEITAICNNKLLTEGFDDTSVEVVVNVSPTLSSVRQQQRTGRGLRVNVANPSKELLIIDCLDTNYRTRPVLFFDENIAGSTGLDKLTPQTNQLLEKLRSYEGPARILADDDSLFDYFAKLLKPSQSKPRPDEVSTEETTKGSTTKLLGHTIINGVLQRSTPRRYIIGSQDSKFRDQGLCAETDPEAFFPEKGGSTKEAKRVCASCDIKEDCLELSLDSGERFGIWGGLSERERRKLSKHVISFATA